MRFGTSAGATFAALTTDVTCGAVNAEADSLNPIAALSPMVGMWLNCIFGGKGVGMINMLLFIIIGIFLAGMMVGRTPEYLGQENWRSRSKARHHRNTRPSTHDSHAYGSFCSNYMGIECSQQSRRAWIITNAISIFFSLSQQWFCF